MRLALALTTLALAGAFPAVAEAGTGGVSVPGGATGGMSVPGEPQGATGPSEEPIPAGGAQAAEPQAPPPGQAAPTPPRDPAPAAGAGVRAGQEAPVDALPAQVDPQWSGGRGAEAPAGDPGRGPTQPGDSRMPFGGVAYAGLAVAIFALLGAAAAAAGIGMRRLVR